MDERREPVAGPPVDAVQSVFQVADVRVGDDDTIYYLGTPLASAKALERELWELFREEGYDVSLTTRAQSEAPFDETTLVEDRFGPSRPQYVLVAEPRSPHIDGVPWTNIVFFVLTVLSTLLVGTQWYYVEIESPLSLLEAWPFTAAILGVLAVHEFGHYVMIRYHDVDASLPYFIPFPSLIGTMGAVIRMRGRIPNRKALFDIGVSGPLAGLVATVVVTVIGLYLDPITVPERVIEGSSTSLRFNDPLLLVILAELTGQQLSYADPTLAANPVIFGGWVGMFVTFLNLLPVGQFDGGHIVRAILGPRQETVAAAVPAALFGLAGYLYFSQEATNAVVLWAFWGLIAGGLAYAGPATPIRDEPIGRRRQAVGVLTLVLGLLCFTPVPFEILAA
ncbi:site-2 protease family protein [Halosimplex sp. TS25]|uniref:site-2 protease family protein n=1 Tax=Halosimplex rarum TaxID=3396619 RepID=UPI0039ECB1B6